MGMHDGFYIFLVLASETVDYTCVLAHQLPVVGIVLDILISVAVHLLAEIGYYIHQLGVIGHGIDHIMKPLVGTDNGADVA